MGAFLLSVQYGNNVEGPIRLALTGSPGTGKTSVSSLLSEIGLEVVSMEMLAEEYDCIGDADTMDGARPIDMASLCSRLEDDWIARPPTNTMVDGHLSHLLPVDCVIIMRCKPVVLKERLVERDYSHEKISQNVDWEILGGTWSELGEGVPVIEFDSSSDSSDSIVESIMSWIVDGLKPERPANQIDWVGRGEV
tara:strand:- start:990 stop:1571 length:582 start_codon:yes stop_codon:yes gene_type:complete